MVGRSLVRNKMADFTQAALAIAARISVFTATTPLDRIGGTHNIFLSLVK
jgi:hypothetical protein